MSVSKILSFYKIYCKYFWKNRWRIFLVIHIFGKRCQNNNKKLIIGIVCFFKYHNHKLTGEKYENHCVELAWKCTICMLSMSQYSSDQKSPLAVILTLSTHNTDILVPTCPDVSTRRRREGGSWSMNWRCYGNRTTSGFLIYI